MTLTKADLVENLANKLCFNKNEANNFVDALFEELRESLSKGEAIKLSGFGNFELRQKNARPGRNPRTGAEVLITARRVVTFHPGVKLKTSIKGCLGEVVP